MKRMSVSWTSFLVFCLVFGKMVAVQLLLVVSPRETSGYVNALRFDKPLSVVNSDGLVACSYISMDTSEHVWTVA